MAAHWVSATLYTRTHQIWLAYLCSTDSESLHLPAYYFICKWLLMSDMWAPPSKITKAMILHSPLLSILLYHIQRFACSAFSLNTTHPPLYPLVSDATLLHQCVLTFFHMPVSSQHTQLCTVNQIYCQLRRN